MITETIGNYTYYTDGRVYSHKKKMFLTGNIDKDGYNRIKQNGKYEGRHIVIARVFIPNPDNLPQVNHKDENPLNNCVDNLEWCTAEYNINYGTRNKRVAEKLSKKIAQYTLDGRLVKIWDSMMDIERELGYAAGHICRCCKGQRKTAYGFIWKYQIPSSALQ